MSIGSTSPPSRAFAVLLALAAPAIGLAQYPAKPIRLLVSVPPGGAPDVSARILGEKLGQALGQPIVVENRVGANGNVAAELTAKSPPDGHTLLLGQDSIFVINPHLYKRMPIDVRRDLVPVATVATNMFVLTVNPSLPAKSFPEYIEYARKANPPLTYASGGNGSVHHLTMELLKQRAGIDLVHVPYKGGSPATIATVAGEVSAMFAGTSTAPQIKAGKLRALAVTGSRRSDAFPDVPTIAEFYPGFEMHIWLGVFAPAATPQGIVGRVREEVNRALALQDVKEKLNAAGGLQPLQLASAEFSALIQRDSARFENVVRSIGVTID
jgi:tripartite-type tricarboxylate transporter receptor subunit TctC